MWYLLQCHRYQYWRDKDGSTVDYVALEAVFYPAVVGEVEVLRVATAGAGR